MSKHLSYRIPSELAKFIDKLATRLGTYERSKALTFCIGFTKVMLDREDIGLMIAPSIAKAYEAMMKGDGRRKK